MEAAGEVPLNGRCAQAKEGRGRKRVHGSK